MNGVRIQAWGLIICGNVWLAAGNPLGMAFFALAGLNVVAALALARGGIWTRDVRWWKR